MQSLKEPALIEWAKKSDLQPARYQEMHARPL